jgi:hypothetical protein
MKLSGFKQDATKITEGIVKKFDAEGKVYIRVGRHNNPKFEADLRKLMEPFKTFRKSRIPEDVVDKNTKIAFSRHILLEMVGFEDDLGDITGVKGSIIPDTEENRLKVLNHKDYQEFIDMVTNLSLDAEAFRVQVEESDMGKSETGPSGPTDGVVKSPSSGTSKSLPEKLPSHS